MFHTAIPVHIRDSEYTAALYPYFLDNSPEMDPERRRPVIIVCPGGGYSMTSDREAECIAMQFLAAGFHAAVLRYSVYPALYPEALLQLAWTVAHLREHAEEYHIDPDHIIIQGSSAGGHLAASYGVFWKKKEFLSETLGVTCEQLRPNGLILSYPVISAGTFGHARSLQHLLGDRYDELREEMSLEKQVDADTPETFLWSTVTDETVPVENSVLFFRALHAKGIPAELHIYPCGRHGLALATEETLHAEGWGVQKECQSWSSLAVEWVRGLVRRTE